MSKIVKMQTHLIDGRVLVDALSELKIALRSVAQDFSYIYAFTQNGPLNFERQKDGKYTLAYDIRFHNCQADQDLLKKIFQQYAVIKIRELTKKAGFEVITTEKKENNTLKMVVRKWQKA